MNELVGKEVTYYSGKYKITSCTPFDSSLVNMIKVAEDTGKYPAYFWLAKILRSGKVSEKQGFVAFISKNGTIIKI